MTSILSVTVESDDLAGAVAFWRTVLDAPEPAVLTWAPGSGSAFFELADGTRMIVSAPRRPQAAEWLGVELLTADPEGERDRLSASGLTVSEVYETDGGSRACVVTTPDGQKFRIGTRWQLPTTDADRSGQAARERTLP